MHCSILFAELPLLARPQAAKDAGFDAIESWWPFRSAVPGDRDVQRFAQAVLDAGVRLVALNTFGGDLAIGERGLASVPGREAEFHDNLDVAVGLAGALGCQVLHVLYGNRVGSTPAQQDELAVRQLDQAAKAAAAVGAVVVVEALSGVDRYPLRTAADVMRVLDRLDRETDGPGARWLCDLYHLAVNGDDLDDVVARHRSRIGHVQIADVPGRHQPGTGRLDLARQIATLYAGGYDGWVGLEYLPLGPSAASFGWLPVGQRHSGGGRA